MNRLPPFPLRGLSKEQIALKNQIANINLNSEIRIIYPSWMRMYTAFDNSLEKEVLILKSCIENDRRSNMGEQKKQKQEKIENNDEVGGGGAENDENDGSYTLDISFKPAILYLLESFPKFVSVKSLPQLSSLQQPSLATALIKQGLVIVKQNK